MNILMVTNTYAPHVGGVARSVAAFADDHRRHGHRVLIVAPVFPGMPSDEVDVVRVPAIQNFNGSDFSVRIPVPGLLATALDDFRPDLVHSHHPFLLGDAAVRIAAERNIPLVFTHHTMYERYTHYVPGNSEALARFAIDLTTGYTHFCDAVIAPSDSVAAVLRQRGVTAPIEVIPTGVNVDLFSQGEGGKIRGELGIPTNAFVVGHVGRLAEEKNFRFLAAAVARFLRQQPQAHFLVVGQGPEEEALRRAFGAKGLRGRMHFAGSRSGQELADSYAAMDVFAFASHSETQGMVLTEAMAAGVPVVALDASGVREVVRDGMNGRLLTGENQRAFAAALARMAANSQRDRQAMSDAARATAEEFSLAHTAQNSRHLYESLHVRTAARKNTDESPWESASRAIEAEWQLWANIANAAKSGWSVSRAFQLPVLGQAIEGWRSVRRLFSPTAWSAKLLGFPSETKRVEPGLVLVQIDGLSRAQLERALAAGRMPFLRKLLLREGSRLHTHYSGLPSTTAAVQAELFYGVKCAVPAFAFGDRATGQAVNMMDTEVASRVQARVAKGQTALLEGGSGTCNMYTGGAAEPHFCASAMGWGELLTIAGPVNAMLLALWNAGFMLRVAVLMAFEFVLGLVDAVGGWRRGRSFWDELKFLPSRLGVTILLRELMTATAKIDVTRGLPVVELNFLGYDEHAHRRGPDSAFAHWSLKGIDGAIKRIWNSAHRSQRREYQLWVYSDHGQERTIPFEEYAGRSLSSIVEDAVQRAREQRPHVAQFVGGSRFQNRARLLGGRTGRLLARTDRPATSAKAGDVLVAATGPLGHIYLPFETTEVELAGICRDLAQTSRVPLVLMRYGAGDVRAWTQQGEYRLPQDAADVLGTDHPFLAAAAEDLTRLCAHPDAGDIVVCGWRPGIAPVSFVDELGAHGGAGPEETRGFALLPFDVANDQPYLRPCELRDLALQALGRRTSPARGIKRPVSRETIRMTTYNVHSCVGMDGRLSPARIARVLAQCNADVIALQELDVRRGRSQGIDQAREVARLLEMEFHFHASLQVEGGAYGNAILSRWPMKLKRAAALPGPELHRRVEPRGAMWAEIEVGGIVVQVINTHLGLLADERWSQVEALLGPQWLGHPDRQGPAVLCGDFNALPSSRSYRRLIGQLRDAQLSLKGHRPRKTWFSPCPVGRLDHVFLTPQFEVINVEVPRTQMARAASDHLPLTVEVRLVDAVRSGRRGTGQIDEAPQEGSERSLVVA